MDRQGMERCLEQVAAYRASGQKASRWSEENGVPLRALSSWCAHAARWRARLDGTVFESAAPRQRSSTGFVAAALPAGSAPTVRVEIGSGATAAALHWPLSHAGELAALLREVAR
ncbi:MAG: hypothetical protein LC119_18500 [Burkholderiales bacterium]|nr:hypothetical protein [Burkholderiales bacterium]